MNSIATKLSSGGRIVLPASLRANLGIQEGDELLLSISNGEVRITPKALALQNALNIARKHLLNASSLSMELIAERHIAAVTTMC